MEKGVAAVAVDGVGLELTQAAQLHDGERGVDAERDQRDGESGEQSCGG